MGGETIFMRVRTIRVLYKKLDETINSIGYQNILNILSNYCPVDGIVYTIIYTGGN